MADLEYLLDAAVEKLLQSSGPELASGLSVQALQEENTRLKAQLAEVQKVDDEEINRLWSLLGDMKHAWDSRALPGGPNEGDIRSGFASVMRGWHEHGQLTAELETLRSELAAQRQKAEQIVGLLETLTSSSKLLPSAVVEAPQKQELVVDHHAIAASVVEMLRPALATLVGGLVQQAVGTSTQKVSNEEDKETQAIPLPIEAADTREVGTQTTEPSPSTISAGDDDAKQTKAKEPLKEPPSEVPAQERKGERRDPRMSSRGEATAPPTKPREERMTSRPSTNDSQRTAPSDGDKPAREEDGRTSRSSRPPDDTRLSQGLSDPRRTTTTRRDRDESRRRSPERSSPQKRARSADPGSNRESPAAKVARPPSAQERETASRSRQGSSRPGTPDRPSRDDREQRRKDELPLEPSRLPPTTRTVRAEDIPPADDVRPASTEPVIKVSVGGTPPGVSTTTAHLVVAFEPTAPPPAQQAGAIGSIRFRADDSPANPESAPAPAEEKPATISTVTRKGDPVDVPAEMYFPVGLLSDKKQLSYKEVKEQVESLMGCPACGWTFTSRDGWAKHQLTTEHKNTIRRLLDAYSKSKGSSNGANHPKNTLHACLACENVLQGTQLVSHFMGKKHLDRCKGVVFGR